jgi:hypothetical protein
MPEKLSEHTYDQMKLQTALPVPAGTGTNVGRVLTIVLAQKQHQCAVHTHTTTCLCTFGHVSSAMIVNGDGYDCSPPPAIPGKK